MTKKKKDFYSEANFEKNSFSWILGFIQLTVGFSYFTKPTDDVRISKQTIPSILPSGQFGIVYQVKQLYEQCNIKSNVLKISSEVKVLQKLFTELNLMFALSLSPDIVSEYRICIRQLIHSTSVYVTTIDVARKILGTSARRALCSTWIPRVSRKKIIRKSSEITSSSCSSTCSFTASDSSSSSSVSNSSLVSTTSIEPISPRCFNERYELIEMLGEGAFGMVYRAKDTHTNGNVIVKSLKEKPDEIPMEVIMMKKLKHEYINELLSFHMESNSFKMVMKCHGEKSMSLQDYWFFTPNQNISEEILSYMFQQIFTGLAYMHGKYIAHMDLKPENIIVNQLFQIKIIDFGLAMTIRDADFDEEPYFDAFGAFSYMSPEQVFDTGFFGPECDIWAMGATLYKMFTGKLPCHDKRERLIMIPQLYREFERPCSPEMLDLLDCLLCKQPRNRITALKASNHDWCNKDFDTEIFDYHHMKAFYC